MLTLDCEFNGHGGRLISMALVSDDGDEFYEVLPWAHHSDTVPWVMENVLPVLNKYSIEQNVFREKLWDFLRKHTGELIIADSPADFVYLLEQCHMLDENEKYQYINLDISMQFRISGIYTSKIPHNALEDARALLGSIKTTQIPS